MRIILVGPPGAGKGTQAQLLNKKTGVSILVTGDLLRDAVKRGDAVGKEADSYMSAGKLVPDEVVTKVILARMDAENLSSKGFMLDGYPRTLQQAQALDKYLEGKKAKIDAVLYFSVPDEIVKARIPGRLICKKCKAIYPNDHDTLYCKNCKEDSLEPRKDDKPEVITERLVEYKQKTAPLLDYYKSKKLLIEIPANRKIDDVFNDCMKHLNQFLNKPKK